MERERTNEVHIKRTNSFVGGKSSRSCRGTLRFDTQISYILEYLLIHEEAKNTLTLTTKQKRTWLRNKQGELRAAQELCMKYVMVSWSQYLPDMSPIQQVLRETTEVMVFGIKLWLNIAQLDKVLRKLLRRITAKL